MDMLLPALIVWKLSCNALRNIWLGINVSVKPLLMTMGTTTYLTIVILEDGVIRTGIGRISLTHSLQSWPWMQ